MEEVWKSIDTLHEVMRPQMAMFALLSETSVQLGHQIQLSEMANRLEDVKEQPFYPHVQAAAKSLLRLDQTARLSVINTLIGAIANGDGSHSWISAASAEQIVGLASGGSQVRCAFGWSLHPALLIALKAKEQNKHLTVTFIDITPANCNLAALCAAALEVDIEIILGMPFERPDKTAYDVEISLPPFGWNISKGFDLPQRTLDMIGQGFSGRLHSEPVAIADALEHASSARVILGLSAGALFRAVGVEAATRHELLRSRRLRAVFGVPSGMIYAETGIATSVLVLGASTERHDFVRFLDLANEHFSSRTSRGRYEAKTDVSWKEAAEGVVIDSAFARDVFLKDIEAQGSILTVERYLRTDGGKLTTLLARHGSSALADVVELIRPVALPKVEEGAYSARESSPGDIAENGYLRPPSRVVAIDRGGLRKARNQQLRPGDLVLSVKGTIGRVGMVPERVPDQNADDFWTVGQSMMILRSDTRMISPEVLYEYLSSDLMQEHLKALAGGAVIQQINMQDLKALPVPLPPKDRQAEIQTAFYRRQELHAQILQLQDEILDMRKAGWPESTAMQPNA